MWNLSVLLKKNSFVKAPWVGLKHCQIREKQVLFHDAVSN
jgi:hypothetical protein